MSTAKILGTLALVSGALLAVACSGGDDASSSCGTECGASKPARKPTSGDPLGTPAGGEEGTTTEPTPTPTPAPDAAPPPPALGPECKSLTTCCGELKSAGYSTTICDGTVSKNDAPACNAAYAGYVSFGDCASPFGPDCTQLNTCCAQIKAANSPTDVCVAAVAKKDQAACKSALTGYKAYGPCT